MKRAWILLTLLCGTAAAAEETPAQRMFERLKGLAGAWEGTYEWSEGRTGGGPIKVEYRVSGAGSAVVEDLIQGGVTSMTSVYHLDAADLRMTHYCAARNQPRLRASRIDEAARLADFAFVDMTGTNPGGHVQRAIVQVVDDDHLNLTFTFGGGKGAGLERILLRRVR